MDKIKIWALFGEAGSGKDFILNRIIENIDNTNRIVSYTTRPPRDYEKDGVDYHFIDTFQFEHLIADKSMLEYTVFNNWYYGTGINSLDFNKINVGVFNPTGISNLLKHPRYMELFEVEPIRIIASPEVRITRQIKREKTEPNYEEILRRFIADRNDFHHINFFYYTLDNNPVEAPLDYKEYLEYYLGDLI